MALGNLSLRREPLDPAQVVSDCVAGVRETALQKGVVIEEAVRPVGEMLADRERLSQVVGNLLNNAIRFTPAGGEVHVRLRGDGRRAVLTVTDTGGGIPPHLLPRIFELGMRHAGSEGFGLGLTIARDIVEHHGGTISAHSDGEGLGASFTIVLPVSAAARG
ncbi:MAG: HAMP domain-containing histidine kinase [Deltaproteobacteria bacterium]|nr:MAG: HAMP domain-containing histidine kinase [Deltaproteobacteria bacterium]